MKIHPVGAEFFRMDRRTHMMKLIVTFRNFVNMPNQEYVQNVSSGYNTVNVL